MQAYQELSIHQDKFIDESAAKISSVYTDKLMIADDSRPDGQDYEEAKTESDEDDDEYGGEDEEFSFASVSDCVAPIAADKAFTDGRIRPFFPLFNQDLLLDNEVVIDQLPSRPPVDNIFIESPHASSISSESEEIEGVVTGPYCTWEKELAPELGKKSNSTGFSKLWRFKEKMSRSHSDGRDAFVFLHNSSNSTSGTEEENSDSSPVKKSMNGDRSSETKTIGEVKVKISGDKVKSKKGGKKKVTTLSPHEVYMRSKLREGERRKSYLPYRPELMGFFTNVHGGGLTRNVHPF